MFYQDFLHSLFMFSFVKNRFTFYTIAIVLFVASILSPWILGLREGIDMTGGIQIEYNVAGGSVDAVVEDTRARIIDAVHASLSPEQKNIISNDVMVYRVSGANSFIVESGINENAARNADGSLNLELIEAAKTAFVDGLKAEYAKNPQTQVEQARYVNIGASFGEYIKQSGYLTLTLAVIAISVYIMYAFRGSIPGMASWPFAVVTGLSLLHDVVIAFGLYVLTSFFLPEFKIDTYFITAMLTVLGYSINDTIVIMDRVRNNIKDTKNKSRPLSSIIDDAIHSTMRRSLFTSLTIVIVLCAMFLFGPESIRGFTLALIFGTVVGTYSSICIAAPLLVDIAGKNTPSSKKSS